MADCIAATGSLVMVGCGRWNGGGKIVWGLRMMWGAMAEGVERGVVGDRGWGKIEGVGL